MKQQLLEKIIKELLDLLEDIKNVTEVYDKDSAESEYNLINSAVNAAIKETKFRLKR